MPAGVAGPRREHADHPDVAAERDGLDAVLGLAAVPRPHGRAEADHVLGDRTPNRFAGTRWPTSCSAIDSGHADGHGQHAEDEREGASPVSLLRSRRRTPRIPRRALPWPTASRRAPTSAPRTPSSTPVVSAGARLCASTTAGDGVDDAGEAEPPVVEGVDAHLVGRVVDRREGAAGRRRPAGPAAPRGTPRRRGGGTPTTGPGVQSHGTSTSSSRSGQDSPRAMGTSIRGGPSWAMVEPSWNSTIEWICCCGWTTTSIRSKGMSKSRCASITSSPLLTSVAEFVVMTRPIEKFGWASACSGVTSASSARVRPRNGPPLAVTTRRRTSSARPPRRHWAIGAVLGVDRHDLARRGRGLDERAPDDERLLVGQGEGGAGRSAARVGRSPIEPVMPLSTTSAPQAAATVAASSPTTTSGRYPRSPVAAATAAAQLLGRRRGPRRRAGRGSAAACCAEQRGVAPGGQRDDPEAVGVGGDDLEGLGADRAGGAEDGDGARGHRTIVGDGGPGPEPAPAQEVKTRSSMSRSETIRARGRKRPCSKSFWTSSSNGAAAEAVLLDRDDRPATEELDRAEVVGRGARGRRCSPCSRG